MNEHIKDMIDACERCQFYKSSKQKQEQIQQTPFKDLFPMAEVGADLFEAGKHHFLIVVDRYSGFPLVARPNSMTAESIIGHMEKMFFLLGRRGEIKCDNGPCFRTEFKNWAKERDITLNNSAPNKPTSNGLLERAVGILKQMLLKHHLNYEAFMHALMEFRLTPRTDSYSPSQVFYGRRMKTDVPITAAALRMRTDLSAAESARQRVSDSKQNSANLQSTSRPDMIPGQTVSVQNPTTKRWDERGIIVEARNPRNRIFKVKVDGTIWTGSNIFLSPVHIPLTDPASPQKGPQRSICDQTNFPPLNPPLPAPPVNAILPTREDEEKKKRPLPEGREKEEEREGQQQQQPTCSSGRLRLCSLTTTKLLSGQVQAAAPMGLPKMLTGQFIFLQQPNNNPASWIKLTEKNMIITLPSLIAAGIATAVVTGGITGTVVYLTAGDADVVTGDQIKTEGGLHILELGHMEPWAIAMMCATLLIGMGRCGACCHKRGKSYVTEKEAKLRDRALGRAKELVHMGAHGADKLLEDVQTYHDMHNEIVVQKMHQITPPGTGGKYGAATHNAPSAQNRDTLPSGSAAASRRRQSSQRTVNRPVGI
jgi:hypothetical protein